MTQASDLGAIPNQSRTSYRGRVNTNFQAIATQHAGTSAPSPTYAGMIWFDTANGLIWIRNQTNSSWGTAIGTINPFAWTAVGSLTGVINSATLSGASVTTTGIPSGIVAFDLNLIGATTAAASSVSLHFGTSGGIVSSGYSTGSEEIDGLTANITNGIYLHLQGAAGYILIGNFRGVLGPSNRWTLTGMSVASVVANANTVTCGTVVLPGELDRFALNASASTFTGGVAILRWYK